MLDERVSNFLNEILCTRQEGTITAIESMRLQYLDYADQLELQFLRRIGVRLEKIAHDKARDQMMIGSELHNDLTRDIERLQRELLWRLELNLSLKSCYLIGAHPLFAGLLKKHQKEIVRMMRLHFATPDRGDVAYFIVSGAAEVRSSKHNVRLECGDVFSDKTLMTGNPRSIDVIALGY